MYNSISKTSRLNILLSYSRMTCFSNFDKKGHNFTASRVGVLSEQFEGGGRTFSVSVERKLLLKKTKTKNK